MSSTATAPWQAQIVAQIGDGEGQPPDATHAAVLIPADDSHPALLLGCAESELAAIVLGEDKVSTHGDDRPTDGEVRVVKVDDLYRWVRAHDAGDTEPELAGTTIEPRRQNVETEEPDQVDVEEEEDDDEAPETEIEPQSLNADTAGGKQLFDASQYDREDLQIPKVDGQSIDRIAIKFSGEIHLDRAEPSDVALYNALKFGKDVAMLVEGRCNATGAKGATDREGDLDVVIGQKSVKVHSISKPAGADWVTEV